MSAKMAAGPGAVVLGPGQADEIAALERACFPDPWSGDQFRTALAGPSFRAMGLRRRGRLAAYMAYLVVADEMEVVNLATHPDFRRQGLARLLLGSVLHLVEKMGIKREFLETRASNAAALALYADFGFVTTGRRRGYYSDAGEDAVVMVRTPSEDNPQGGASRETRWSMGMKFLDQMDIAGKKLLVRVDYNVPLDGDRITDDLRIRASLPTLRYALDKGAALILCSHLGKPKGQVNPKFSLKPAAVRLAELLGRPVAMAPDCVGPETAALAAALKPGQILMLENLRFHSGEEKNDPEFARQLAELAEAYVCDAFGTAHRAHASMVGVTAYLKDCCAGFLLQKEWEYLGEAVRNPKRPLAAISGGAKVSSKLGVLKSFLEKVDVLLIGGAMANTFLAAKGLSVGASLVEPDLFDAARDILAQAEAKGVRFLLPVDFVISMDAGKPLAEMRPAGVCADDAVPEGAVMLDVGPKTVTLYVEALASAKTIVWNGPLGAFENPAFAGGSVELAKAVAGLDAMSIVGGGDTDALVHLAGVADRMSFISTGGGASLEFLEGKELPAFKALAERAS